MTNQEVHQFFVDNGAYPDFEIVNSPNFDIIVMVDGIEKTRFLQTGTGWYPDLKRFIDYDLNNFNKKWYIYNDMKTSFVNTNREIRCCSIDSPDRLMKYRTDKIKNITERINEKY